MDLPFHRDALPPGSRLGNWLIEDVLSVSRRAIVYRASGVEASEVVAIKEYFPAELVSRDASGRIVPRGPAAEAAYRAGLRHFAATAHALCELTSHARIPGLVQVRELLKVGDTPFAVLGFEPGPTLAAALSAGAAFGEAALTALLREVGQGLGAAHAAGVHHGAITPADIILVPGGRTVLVGFGAGGRGVDASLEPSPYAAVEQYADVHAPGPWTDIYRLGAVLHHAVCGKPPAEVTLRSADGALVRTALPGFSRDFLRAIDAAMEIGPQRRPQSIADWLALLPGAEPRADAPAVVGPPPAAAPPPADVPRPAPKPRAAVPPATAAAPRPVPAQPKNRLGAILAVAGLLLAAAFALLYAAPGGLVRVVPPTVLELPSAPAPEAPEALDAEVERIAGATGRIAALAASTVEAGLPPAATAGLRGAADQASADLQEARRLRAEGEGPRLDTLRAMTARLGAVEAAARRSALTAYALDGERLAVAAAGDIVAFATLNARDGPALDRLRVAARDALHIIQTARDGLQTAPDDLSDAAIARVARSHATIGAQARLIARRLAEARALPPPLAPRLLPPVAVAPPRTPRAPAVEEAPDEAEPAPRFSDDPRPADRSKLSLLRQADRQLRAVQSDYDRLRSRLGRGRPDRPYGRGSIYGEAEGIYDALLRLRSARARIARSATAGGASRAYDDFAYAHDRLASRIADLRRAI
jgi:hypothetical protein